MKQRKGSSPNGKSKSTTILRQQQKLRNDGRSNAGGAALVGAALAAAAAADNFENLSGRMRGIAPMIIKGDTNENEEHNEEGGNGKDDDDGDSDNDAIEAYFLEGAIEDEGSSGTTATATARREMKELSLAEMKARRNASFEDSFSDDILTRILRCLIKPTDIWEAGRVCRRWYVLQTCLELKKRSFLSGGRVSCLYPSRHLKASAPECPRQKVLKLDKVESEFALAAKFRNSCKRHTHGLNIKDCAHLSNRGYQLISEYVANLKFIRLESCSSMDDASLGAILSSGASSLRSVHLSSVPRLTLSNVSIKAPQLRQLHVFGCTFVTGAAILSVLKGCPNLDSLCLSAMGASSDWEDKEFGEGAPLKLRRLDLMNTKAVTDTLLQLLAPRVPLLRHLDLSDCPFISDEGLKPVIAACGAGLQQVVLSRSLGVSDGVVDALWEAPAAKLQGLSLAGTGVTDEGLRTLMKSKEGPENISGNSLSLQKPSKGPLGKLTSLSVACCPSITDAGLLHIVTGQSPPLGTLKALDIQSCPGLSALGLKKIRIAAKGKQKEWKLVCDL